MCVRASEEALVRVPCTCEDEKRNTGKHFESPHRALSVPLTGALTVPSLTSIYALEVPSVLFYSS